MPESSRSDLRSFHAVPDRRRVILAGSAIIGAAMLPQAAAADGLGSAADLLAGARRFLTGLEPDQRTAASFAWNGREWNGWNYFGVGGYIKPGLRFEQMSPAQKAAAWDLLTALFSPRGIDKTRNVMTLQDVLAARGDGAGQRSSERFSFAFFGDPSETGAWGFRLEGHHLSHSIAVRDGMIVAITPSSFSANPNRVTAGRHAGLVTLKEEEALARRLIGDLGPPLQARARLSDTAMRNILSYAGRGARTRKKSGSPPASFPPGSAICCGS